jgi:hypothetical protein
MARSAEVDGVVAILAQDGSIRVIDDDDHETCFDSWQVPALLKLAREIGAADD